MEGSHDRGVVGFQHHAAWERTTSIPDARSPVHEGNGACDLSQQWTISGSASGFDTAVSEAQRASYAANIEAEAAHNGIGLVKLMGRESGFIAAYTVLVNSQVNFCLIPEVPFTLEKFLAALEDRLKRKGHALVIVAEGAGMAALRQTRKLRTIAR